MPASRCFAVVVHWGPAAYSYPADEYPYARSGTNLDAYPSFSNSHLSHSDA